MNHTEFQDARFMKDSEYTPRRYTGPLDDELPVIAQMVLYGAIWFASIGIVVGVAVWSLS
jgi:hypothetical protein